MKMVSRTMEVYLKLVEEEETETGGKLNTTTLRLNLERQDEYTLW